MTTRTRRTAEQIANDLEARARVARTKVKNMERAQQTRRAVIAGMTIDGMAAAGDAEAKRVWDRMLDGLTRKQDRLAFGLKPLPEPGPDNQPSANPLADPVVAAADPLAFATARLERALKAWSSEKPTEAARIEVGQAIAGLERVTGKLWENLPSNQRVHWDLSDRPGELHTAS